MTENNLPLSERACRLCEGPRDGARYEICICGSVFCKVFEKKKKEQWAGIINSYLDFSVADLLSAASPVRNVAPQSLLPLSFPGHHSQAELAAEGVFGASDLLSDLRCNGVHC